jgi:hypothetical protein
MNTLPAVPRAAGAALLLAVTVTGCHDVPTTPDGPPSAVAQLAMASLSRPNTPEQVNLTFRKAASESEEGVWEGWVAGDIEGELRTELQHVRVAGRIWHVEFRWIITGDDPAHSLTFHASGTLNTQTGRVVMNGTVMDGFLTGARVHEEGQAQDAAGAVFEGIITIMRRTS